EISQLQMLATVPQSRVRIPGNILTGRTIRRYEAFRECETYKVAVSNKDSQEFGNQYGIHILFKQADDGSVILGDSHVYANEECQLPFDRREDIDEFMLTEAKQIYDLPDYRISQRWIGRYAQCKQDDIFTTTIDDRIHIVAGIGGKGMTAGPGFAQQHIQRIFDMNQGEHHIIPNVSNHYELVVFDMAGTVVEEDNLVYRTLREAIVRAGFAIDLEEVFAEAAGMEKRQGIYNCLLSLGLPPEKAEVAADPIHEDFKATLWSAYEKAEIRAKPGAEQLFSHLRSTGSKVALNTGYARPIAELLLKKLKWSEGVTIDALVTATDVNEGRPSPAMIDQLRQRLGVTEPKAVAKVGDSTVDIEEGQNAGCGLVVGITTGAHTRTQLASAKPDLIVNELSELGQYLKVQG
ncbi:MAG: HAD family hydrolase, partial [Bacteroidota bacterium]